MSWSLACHECDHRDGRTNSAGDVLPAYSYHDSEGEALEERWEHAERTGHDEIYCLGGCYFIGDGPRPRRLPDGDDVDRYTPLDVLDPPSSRMYPTETHRSGKYRDTTTENP